MNWFDFALIAVVVLGLIMGLKTGLIGAAFIALGAFLGGLLAGQLSDDIGAIFSNSLTSDTVVTVVSYVIIMGGCLVGASIVKKSTMPILNVLTLGLTAVIDKLGGAVLGLVVGLVISLSLVIGMARLTYNFELVDTVTSGIPEQIPGQITQLASEGLAKVTEARGFLESTLIQSQLVPTAIDVKNLLPADTLGFVPSDFKTALEILENKVE